MATTQKSTFFRLLSDSDKGQALLAALGDRDDDRRFDVDTSAFGQVPTTPFAYWVNDRIRRLFVELPPFASEGREVKQGLATADDFRFVRCWWEVPTDSILDGRDGPWQSEDVTKFQRWCRQRTFEGKKWVPFAKGGEYSPYYTDLHLVVSWENAGGEIKARINPQTGKTYSNVGMLARTEKRFFFRSGLTFPTRPSVRGGFSLVPPGCLFGHNGSMVFGSDTAMLAALFNSDFVLGIVGMFMSRGGLSSSATLAYEVGQIRKIPFQDLSPEKGDLLQKKAAIAWSLRSESDREDERSHRFAPTALLRSARVGVAQALTDLLERSNEVAKELTALHDDIEALCRACYEIDETVAEGMSWQVASFRDAMPETNASEHEIASRQVSLLVGTAFGRWNLERVSESPKEDPVEEAGEPLSPSCVFADTVRSDGIIVQDSENLVGTTGLLQSVAQSTSAFGADASFVEQDLAKCLEVPSLDHYLRDPRLFFDHHLKQYSIYRRRAPIYWPLGVPSGRFIAWVYYPTVDSETLFTILVDHVEPRRREIGRQIESLRGVDSLTKQQKGRLEWLSSLEAEMEWYGNTLSVIAQLPYRPNQHDGVLISAAPLHDLFQHRDWSKATAKAWKELQEGNYDWSHLAMAIWPDRVRDKCRKDKSLAIAHGVEDLYEGDR